MAKSMRNDARKEARINETRALLVKAALDAGKITRKDICNATDMKMYELTNLFAKNRELYAEYVVRRKTIADIASDNILDIINDPKHPQHFQASKYVLSKYKSDLDDVLDSHEDIMEIIDPTSVDASSPVRIVFSKGKRKEE